MNNKVATIISRIFDPFIMMTIVLVLALHKSTLPPSMQIRLMALMFVLMIGVPAGLVVAAIKKGIVVNWDMSNRKERPRVLLLLLAIEGAGLFVLRGLMDPFLFHTVLFILLLLCGFIVITLFWKISGHTCLNALATGMVVSWYGLFWWPILLIVPVVGWARVARRDHTIAQVVSGAVYSWLLIIVSSVMFHVS